MSEMDRCVAVVTGAASGIGRALAQQLAQRVSALVVVDIDGAGAATVAISLNRRPSWLATRLAKRTASM